MLLFKHKTSRASTRILTDSLSAIERNLASEVAWWTMEDGTRTPSGCLGCVDEPCRLIGESECAVSGLEDFSNDSNREVCPVGAIAWDASLETPWIEEESCIGCGLCVARCPAGSMSIRDGVAHVSTLDPANGLLEKVSIVQNASQQRQQVSALPGVEVVKPVRADRDVMLVSAAASRLSDIRQKHFVRSALLACDASILLSRKGDVHTRADGFFQTHDGTEGGLEIELEADSLEALRAALEASAVFYDRFGISISHQNPLIVCRFLPRERQGYWQVVRDISKVLKMEIHTISLGALLIFAWNGVSLDGRTLLDLNPTFQSTSIREVVEGAIDRPIDILLGEGGILEPEK